ncbi:luciferase-like protein [Egicoccus halophilus]|uniref:Luciferase-like protein n=1 Tax=Egicoccus halophilus TaxID=1670830 RepID=A0A8J3EXK3_9ACTN|nr:luciferase-like protein [Egicoccus halophilus]
MALGGPYAFLRELAKQVEAKGFDAAWVSETTQNATIQAAVLAQATSRIDIGTNITLAFPRSPVITAMEAWDLNEVTGDRFVVGLGSQVKRIIEERFSADFDRPAKRMAEYVQAMQTAWRMERGEDVTFEGEIYRVLRPGLGGRGRASERALPRVYVAAVGPLMTRAAASYADGLLGHPFTSDRYLTGDVLPRVDEALAAAGRDRDAFTICQGVILCIADDREVAVREAKQQIAFYGTTPNYQAVFASYGDEELTDRLRAVWRDTDRDLDAMVAAVPDEAVERYAVAGTPEEVRDRLSAIEAHVDHVILGGAWYGVSPQRLAENLWAILETFGTG